eukprot:339706-Lingulodinium_polyedra.AAC.1
MARKSRRRAPRRSRWVSAHECVGVAPQWAMSRRIASATCPPCSSRGVSRSTLASPPTTIWPPSAGSSSS